MFNIKKLFSTIFILYGLYLNIHAQKITVTGKVTDAITKEPLPSVAVYVEGTYIGTVTDITGKFSITVPDKNAILTFSLIGYQTKKIEVGENTYLIVEMEEEVKKLEEVVVVGYGTQKKESVIGAISTLGNKDLLKTPASNITQAIAGKVPGLITTQNQGQPGYDEADIYIRGRASFASDNAPLVLVDGVERKFSQISPDDIEQISVLKDASATAVYGVRGANGVILITTKKGYEGKPVISLRANYSIQTPTKLIKYLDSYNSVLLLEEALKNDGLPSQYTEQDLEYFKLASEGKLTGDLYYLYPNVDWYNEALNKSAPSQEYNINVTGGTKRMSYYVSLGYLDQKGLYKDFNSYDYGHSANARFQRYTFRSNLDFKLTSMFTMSINLSTRFENRKGPNVREEPNFNEIFYELNRTPGWIFPVQWPDGRYGGNAFAQRNVVALLAKGGFYDAVANYNETNLILNHKLDFITKGLSIKAMGSFDYFTDYDRRFSAGFATYELINRSGDLNDPNNYRKYNEDSPLANTGNNQTTSLKTYLEVGLNYTRTFGKHEITGLLLYNQNNYRYQAEIPSRYQGLVGRITYNFSHKYFFEGNFGYNGSENFAKGNRFGFFPSVSVGWMLSNEEFFKKLDFVDIFKIKASYGEVGNDKYKVGGQVVRFLYISSWVQGGGYTFGDNNFRQGIYEGRVPNINVTWERAKKYNFGLESSYFKNLLSANIEIFYEDRSNILAEYQSKAGWLGVDLAPANIGKASNRGYEIELRHRNKIGNFFYTMTGTYARAKNKIKFCDEPAGMPAYMKNEGLPIRQYFGLVVDGFFTSEEEIANSPIQTFGPVKVGDLKYKDLNNDGFIDLRDVTAIGYSDIPENTFSFSLEAGYKRFTISALFQGVTNVSRYYDAEIMYAFLNGGKVREHHLNRWDPSKSVEYNLSNAKYPLLHYGEFGNNNQQLNSFFLKDGSFFRLKNVEIGYELPEKIAKKLFTSQIRIYANGMNLITWDKLEGIADPETNGSNKYPIMKVYNIGLNVKF